MQSLGEAMHKHWGWGGPQFTFICEPTTALKSIQVKNQTCIKQTEPQQQQQNLPNSDTENGQRESQGWLLFC